MKSSDKRKEISSEKLLVVITIISMIFAMLNTIVTSRYLGAEGRGMIQFVLSAQGLLATCSSLGLGISYLYMLKKKSIDIGLIDIILKVITVFIVITPTFLFLQQTDEYEVSAISVSLIVLFTAISFTLMDVMKVECSLKGYRYALIYPIAFNLFINLFLLFFGLFNVNTAVLSLLISCFSQTLYCFYYIKYKIDEISFSYNYFTKIKIFSYVKYSGTMAVTVILVSISNNIDKFFVFNKLGLMDLGRFSIIVSVCAIINKIFDSLCAAYFSKRIINSENKIFRFKDAFKKLMLLSALLSPLIYMCGEIVLPYIFGYEFSGLGFVLIIMMSNSLLSGINAIAVQEFNVKGKPIYTVYRLILSIILFVILANLLLEYGLVGITVSVFISSLFRYYFSTQLLRKL